MSQVCHRWKQRDPIDLELRQQLRFVAHRSALATCCFRQGFCRNNSCVVGNAFTQILSFLTMDDCCPLPSATVAWPFGNLTTAKRLLCAAHNSSPSAPSMSCGSTKARSYFARATVRVLVVFQPSISFLLLEVGLLTISLIRLVASAAHVLCAVAHS